MTTFTPIACTWLSHLALALPSPLACMHPQPSVYLTLASLFPSPLLACTLPLPMLALWHDNNNDSVIIIVAICPGPCSTSPTWSHLHLTLNLTQPPMWQEQQQQQQCGHQLPLSWLPDLQVNLYGFTQGSSATNPCMNPYPWEGYK